MPHAAVVGLSCLLALAPPETEATGSTPELIEDMPDPYGSNWDPPTAPKPPPPPPPPPSADTSPREVVEAPPASRFTSPATNEAAAGKNLQTSGIVVGALGVAGIGLGAYLLNEKKQTTSSLNAEQQALEVGVSTQARVQELESKLSRQRIGATASFIAGGSVLALGVLLYLVGRKANNQSQPSLTVSTGKRFSGLTLQGKF